MCGGGEEGQTYMIKTQFWDRLNKVYITRNCQVEQLNTQGAEISHSRMVSEGFISTIIIDM